MTEEPLQEQPAGASTEEAPDPSPAVGPEKAAGGGGDASPPPKQGLDLQLVGLAAVLWVVAVAIVFSKWERVRVDWRLGDIKERLDLDGGIDETALDGLIAMGQSDPEEVVGYLGDELYGPQRNLDERYRIVLVKALEKIPGRDGLVALCRAANDIDPRVRANAYVSLAARAKATPEDREDAVKMLEAMLGVDPEPVARAYTVRALSELGALQEPRVQACWPFLVWFREAQGSEGVVQMIRTECARAVRQLSQVPEERLPLDPAADEAAREAQLLAWETWFREAKGEVPAGQSHAEWQARRAAAAAEQKHPESQEEPR